MSKCLSVICPYNGSVLSNVVLDSYDFHGLDKQLKHSFCISQRFEMTWRLVNENRAFSFRQTLTQTNEKVFLSVSKVSGGRKQCEHGSVTFRFTSRSGRYAREELEHSLP